MVFFVKLTLIITKTRMYYAVNNITYILFHLSYLLEKPTNSRTYQTIQ